MKKSMILAAVLVLSGLGISTAEAGLLRNLWELEKRKNAWLAETFFGRKQQCCDGYYYYYYYCYPCDTHYGCYPQYDGSSHEGPAQDEQHGDR